MHAKLNELMISKIHGMAYEWIYIPDETLKKLTLPRVFLSSLFWVLLFSDNMSEKESPFSLVALNFLS